MGQQVLQYQHNKNEHCISFIELLIYIHLSKLRTPFLLGPHGPHGILVYHPLSTHPTIFFFTKPYEL